MSVLIIAEAGVNHNGDPELARKMVDAAKAAGVDCIKFQTFVSKNIASKSAYKADYQRLHDSADETQFAMLQKLELSFSDFSQLEKYCKNQGMQFLSTPFDLESIEFLASLGMGIWKIPSGEITNLPYLIKIAQTHKPIILSTGMSTLDEVAAALQVLRANGSGEIILLHCTTEYPAPYESVNLKAMDMLKKNFQVSVGYSDHTTGTEIAIAAVALGATVIEKHFTLDRNMEGPDHRASLEPVELKSLVKAIRCTELALGNGEKKPAEAELKNIAVARKSIVARCDIKKGELLTENNLTVKRPGNGISPMKWFEVLGQKAVRDFAEDEMIRL